MVTCENCIHYDVCEYRGLDKYPSEQALKDDCTHFMGKQSEWISVDDRLPELETTRSDGYHRPRSVRVLCVCKQRSGKVFVKEGYYELWGNKPCWRIPGSIDSVTHWMPLPEPPKMKGGEK